MIDRRSLLGLLAAALAAPAIPAGAEAALPARNFDGYLLVATRTYCSVSDWGRGWTIVATHKYAQVGYKIVDGDLVVAYRTGGFWSEDGFRYQEYQFRCPSLLPENFEERWPSG